MDGLPVDQPQDGCQDCSMSPLTPNPGDGLPAQQPQDGYEDPPMSPLTPHPDDSDQEDSMTHQALLEEKGQQKDLLTIGSDMDISSSSDHDRGSSDEQESDGEKNVQIKSQVNLRGVCDPQISLDNRFDQTLAAGMDIDLPSDSEEEEERNEKEGEEEEKWEEEEKEKWEEEQEEQEEQEVNQIGEHNLQIFLKKTFDKTTAAGMNVSKACDSEEEEEEEENMKNKDQANLTGECHRQIFIRQEI